MGFLYLVPSVFITSVGLMWLYSKVFTNEPGTIGLLIMYVLGFYIPYSLAKKFGWAGVGD